MSAFGRARRSVYLDASLWELLKVAAPHESHDSAETLHDEIIRSFFAQPEKQRYADLLRMRDAAREQADKEWASSLRPSNTTE